MKKKPLKLAALILCACLIFGGAAPISGAEGDAVPRRISIAVNGDPATRRGITWHTGANVGSVVRVYPLDGGSPGSVECDEVYEWEGNFVHKALVKDLTPGGSYRFSVGDGETFGPDGFFSTDDRDDKTDFLVIADIQATPLENFQKGAQTVEAGFATMPTAEFMINLGDFTNDSTNEEWDFYDQALAQINAERTIVPVAGNHDGLNCWHWFENMFNLDESESVQTYDGVNYSFDYGNVHFTVVNTNDVLSISLPQLKWLRNDLNGTDKDWKIVCMHKSVYTLGKDGKWPDAGYLKTKFRQIMDDCGVDLVLSGHDHQYLRTKPLKNNKENPDGTTYVLAGTAGTKRYQVRPFLADPLFTDPEVIAALTVQKGGYGNYWDAENKNWDKTKETNIGGCFNCASVNGGELRFESYILADNPDESGKRPITNIDSFVLAKETGKNRISFTGDNTTSRTEYIVSAVPSFLSLAAYSFGNWLPRFLAKLPQIIASAREGTF